MKTMTSLYSWATVLALLGLIACATAVTHEVDVIAIEHPMVLNKWGDHMPNGILFSLKKNLNALEGWKIFFRDAITKPKPIPRSPLTDPLVLRAAIGDTLIIHFENHVQERRIGIHLNAAGYDVESDGAAIGNNLDSRVGYREQITYTWQLKTKGVFTFADGSNFDGRQQGTHARGLWGSLVVLGVGQKAFDPQTGTERIDGISAYVCPNKLRPLEPTATFPEQNPRDVSNDNNRCYRDFVVEFHGENEVKPGYLDKVPHTCEEKPVPVPTCVFSIPRDYKWPSQPETQEDYDPYAHIPKYLLLNHEVCQWVTHKYSCVGKWHGQKASTIECGRDLNSLDSYACRTSFMIRSRDSNVCGRQPSKEDVEFQLTTMKDVDSSLINYASEQEERTAYFVDFRKHFGLLKTIVYGEEAHHSSWFTGDPYVPILRGYVGDPFKVRLVHAGVKETHIYHQHVYQWNSVDSDPLTVQADAVTITPGYTGTLSMLYGFGSRSGNIGDAVFHCHLYPHFAGGMWGMTRSYDTRHEGIDVYPDGTRIPVLTPLPDRVPPPRPTQLKPGWPNFMACQLYEKSCRVPWPTDLFGPVPKDYDYRAATGLERLAMNDAPQLGAFFMKHPFPEGQLNHVRRDVNGINRNALFSKNGLHNPSQTFYTLAEETPPSHNEPRPYHPFTHRANIGDVVETHLTNQLPTVRPQTAYHKRFPLCNERPWEGELGMHVHLVKFDQLTGDGASIGWNYLSGARHGKKFIFRWWLDEDLGTIFFHDHMFANYRQKLGLYGTLSVHPAGSEYVHPKTNQLLPSGINAVIRNPAGDYREFVIFVGDFQPAYRRDGTPINPPSNGPQEALSNDEGIIISNYRVEPFNNRRDGDPAQRFSSFVHGDPFTDIFETNIGDKIKFRVIAGSHEELHSFSLQNARWNEQYNQPKSRLISQLSFGVSEVFTLETRYQIAADHLWFFSMIQDLWQGNWGIVRVYGNDNCNQIASLRGGLPNCTPTSALHQLPRPRAGTTQYYSIIAEARTIHYSLQNGNIPGTSDPLGMVFRALSHRERNYLDRMEYYPNPRDEDLEPLVMRAREGEWIEINVFNQKPEGRILPADIEVLDDIPNRKISQNLNLFASGIQRDDMLEHGGAAVGFNGDNFIRPGEAKTFRYFCDEVGAFQLRDFGDWRYAQMHGLFATIVCIERAATPESWIATQTKIAYKARAKKNRRDIVLHHQDGFRAYFNGDLNKPVPDAFDECQPFENNYDYSKCQPKFGEEKYEDQGNKAYNYRHNLATNEYGITGEDWIQQTSYTQVFEGCTGQNTFWHIVAAGHQPRTSNFALHGHQWKREDYIIQPKSTTFRGDWGPNVALATRTLKFKIQSPGDWLYRSAKYLNGMMEGEWGIMRAQDAGPVCEKYFAPTFKPSKRDLRQCKRKRWALYKNIDDANTCYNFPFVPTASSSSTSAALSTLSTTSPSVVVVHDPDDNSLSDEEDKSPFNLFDFLFNN